MDRLWQKILRSKVPISANAGKRFYNLSVAKNSKAVVVFVAENGRGMLAFVAGNRPWMSGFVAENGRGMLAFVAENRPGI